MVKTKLITLKIHDYILIFLTLSLVLVDWRINTYITFSDLLVFITLIILAIHKHLIFEKKQLLIYLFIITYVALNVLLHNFIDSDFDLANGIISFFKVSLYLASMIFFSNFISWGNMEIILIDYLYKASAIVSIIGIYMYISMLFNNIFPYEFMWKFTRSDISSYTYAGSDNIFRMRSIFSEPAHMGFFLLIVLGISYFNKFEFRLSNKSDLLITFSLILSFSFSSIVILTILKILNLLKNKSISKLFNNKGMWITIPILIAFLLRTKNIIETTFISRIQRMMLGEDTSANSRLTGSWSNINFENFLIGNGIGNSTNIFNNYAYILSDIGIIGLLVILIFNYEMLKSNKYLFFLFVLLNFMKGGYLGAGFWIFIMVFIVYSFDPKIKYDKLSSGSQ